jgi:cytosine/adenosine deaminase-related metal-dependent hydrolase
LVTRSFRRNFEAVAGSPLRVWSCLEFYDLDKHATPQQMLNTALRVAAADPRSRGGHGVSPHAPYTTSADLFEISRRLASRRRLPLATHIAESEDEWEMFINRRGELFEALTRSDFDFSPCGRLTPVEWLFTLGVLTRRCIGIHMNYLEREDFEIVARSGMSVVHCPRSHEYFGHRKFPLERLRKLGVNVCLGTDSAASVDLRAADNAQALDMFAEMRTLHRNYPRLCPSDILQMATLNGARALGRERHLGSIERGKYADLIAVAMPCAATDLAEAVVCSRQRVCFVMVLGKSVVPAS